MDYSTVSTNPVPPSVGVLSKNMILVFSMISNAFPRTPASEIAVGRDQCLESHVRRTILYDSRRVICWTYCLGCYQNRCSRLSTTMASVHLELLLPTCMMLSVFVCMNSKEDEAVHDSKGNAMWFCVDGVCLRRDILTIVLPANDDKKYNNVWLHLKSSLRFMLRNYVK
jgi:hypothetical protein